MRRPIPVSGLPGQWKLSTHFLVLLLAFMVVGYSAIEKGGYQYSRVEGAFDYFASISNSHMELAEAVRGDKSMQMQMQFGALVLSDRCVNSAGNELDFRVGMATALWMTNPAWKRDISLQDLERLNLAISPGSDGSAAKSQKFSRFKSCIEDSARIIVSKSGQIG